LVAGARIGSGHGVAVYNNTLAQFSNFWRVPPIKSGPALGLPPSLPPVKECSTVSVPLGESLNTTPHPNRASSCPTAAPKTLGLDDGSTVRKVPADAIRDELKNRGLLETDNNGQITATSRSHLQRVKAELVKTKGGKLVQEKGFLWRP
jgi:hypothetical protein